MEEQKPDLVQLEENVSKSQAEFPPGMAPKMLKLAKMMNDLEKKLEPLISKAHHEVLNKMPPVERAKMGLMEVYTINSLFWTLMRTSGENVDSTLKEDYKIEMGRLKETQTRLAEVEARAHRQRVNIEAASRFIQHGLGIYRRTNEADATGEESQDLVHSDVTRKQKKKYKYDAVPPRTSGHQDTVDQAMDYQEQEEAVPQASSHTNSVKKRKNMDENSIIEPDADESAEISHENSGYQASAEESFISTPKKQKAGKKLKVTKKVKSADGENGVGATNVKKFKKKKVVKTTNVSPAEVLTSNKVIKKKKVGNKTHIQETDTDRNGYADNQDTVAQTQKKKKKKKQQVTKQSDFSSCLDTTGSGIVVEDDRDCTNKSREWYEQGWT